MSKVFIVTQGQYSDYGIRAVFSSRRRAERYMAGGGGDSFEEFDIDADAGKVSRKAFVFRVDHRNGDATDWDYSWVMAPPRARSAPAHVNTHGRYSLVHSFVSKGHARKLAAEEWQRYLRESGGAP